MRTSSRPRSSPIRLSDEPQQQHAGKPSEKADEEIPRLGQTGKLFHDVSSLVMDTREGHYTCESATNVQQMASRAEDGRRYRRRERNVPVESSAQEYAGRYVPRYELTAAGSPSRKR